MKKLARPTEGYGLANSLNDSEFEQKRIEAKKMA